MAERLLLAPKHRAAIEALLKEHLPGVEVWAYGSRVNGRAHDGSDLDLVLRASGLREIPDDRFADLKDALRDSNIPFLVEARDWARLPETFHKEIERDYVVLVGKEECRGSGDWPRLRLGDCMVINDSTYSPKEAWPFINYLDTGSITENQICEIQHLTVGKDKIPSRARRKVQPGDIVYSTVRPNQRHFGLLKRIPENFLASTGFSVLRGKTGVAYTNFLYWYLAQDRIVEQLHTTAEHSTSAYPSIRSADIGQLQVDLPPLPEQRAIAHVLGTLDDKIELNRRMNETLETVARAIFRDWFVDFGPTRAKAEGRKPYLSSEIWELFPDALDDKEKPAGWELSEIGNEVNAVGGATPSTKEPAYWNEGTHCWATPKDLSKLSSPVLLDTDRRITDVGVNKISSRLLPIGTVLMSSRAPIGYLAIAEVATTVNQGFIAMVCNRRLPNVFVLLWCYENLDYIKGISSGSTFAEISKKDFRPVSVIVPSAQILTIYEEIIRPLYNYIVSNMKESALLAQTRDLLLPKLISGEIRLREAEKAVEAVA